MAEKYLIRITTGCGQKKGATAVRRKAMILSFALVLFVALSVTAGTTGKIAGRVTDTSGNPLIGATVMVVGTSYGAMTDANGEYFIINLQPGMYSVKASMVGMGDMTAEGVAVVVDQTSPMNFSLDPATIGITTITVTDSRGLIMMDATETFHVVGREEIKTMPVAGIADVINRQAGATTREGLHMRGGRSGEVTYMVDGVAQVDPTMRGFTSSIPLSGVAEISTISGGFGAEYGNAQSGVINIVTREGGRDYNGSLGWNGNNWQELGLASGWTWGGTSEEEPGEWRWSNVSPFSDARNNLEGSIGGPEPFTSYLLPAIGLDIPGDMRMFFSGEYLQTGGGIDGRYGYGFDDWQTTWTGNLKLTYKPNPKTKINLTGYYMDSDFGYGTGTWSRYNSRWEWSRYQIPFIDTDTSSTTYGDTLAWGEDVLWGCPTYFRENYSFGASITQTLSDATFMEVRLNQFQSARDNKIYNNPDDTTCTTEFYGEDFSWDDWQNVNPSLIPDSDGFWRAGRNARAWGENRSTISTFRTDITSQLNQQHQLKAGVEVKYYDVFSYSIFTASGGNIYANRYHVFPHTGSAYIQDKMEYRGMIVNAGLRFDYFDPCFDDYPADLTDPINEGTHFGDDDYIKNPLSVPVKYHLSPRIGFSHPITERDVLHFSYGHYFQTPEFDNMYEGSDYNLSGAYSFVGNPTLSVEETIAYEIGVKHMLDDITVMSFSGYYKDITGLLDTQKNYYNPIESYDLYINGDYGNVRGAEFNLVRRPSDFWSGSVNYAYSIAMGKSSSARQNYDYAWANWVIPRTESPLDWDERHRVNAEFDFRIPRGEGPRIGDTPLLEGFGVHVSWTYGSGYPYSPSGQGTAQPLINANRYPWTMMTTLKVNKTFWIGPVILDAYCQVNNLFNRHNINYINDADIAWYDADMNGDGEPDHDPKGALGNPYVFSRPRTIMFGLGFEW
ncbi:MAG: TonB-dependent receptor plug domain-containing protein [Candidatus Aegiribacteria sp.]|nr:TonB-dependent receptor plug domain-containing protein [Candidatus Aegiribacteria sp.]